nr:hypothetical protein [Desulfobacterales bacterium]
LASGIGLKAVEAGYKVLFNEYRSLMITTNKDFTKWEEFFFEENVAVPMVDRIIHHSHILMLGGEGYRLKKNTFL